MSILDGLAPFVRFCTDNLTGALARAEASVVHAAKSDLSGLLAEANVTDEALAVAGELKRIAGQVNVAIHALGILLSLPHVLNDDEVIEYVSLGAGNTGRTFDLETNQRVAEFKFIAWKGGPESIRQNGIFKDFFNLAEHPTTKGKHLYVLGLEFPLKFLNGGRALKSVLKDAVLARAFQAKYGTEYATVRDYYLPRRDQVSIEDMSPWLGSLSDPPRE